MNETPSPEKLDLFGVRDGDWKLVVDKKCQINALYNLKEDLAESHDLSGQYPEVKERLYEYGRDFLSKSRPACGKISGRNTRANGDRIKIDSLKKHYFK